VERCRIETPLLRRVGTGHLAACHLAGGEIVEGDIQA
jgi:hypothetical protein